MEAPQSMIPLRHRWCHITFSRNYPAPLKHVTNRNITLTKAHNFYRFITTFPRKTQQQWTHSNTISSAVLRMVSFWRKVSQPIIIFPIRIEQLRIQRANSDTSGSLQKDGKYGWNKVTQTEEINLRDQASNCIATKAIMNRAIEQI